eukprot:1161803-Pelagomonas_calceolata.AAC.16
MSPAAPSCAQSPPTRHGGWCSAWGSACVLALGQPATMCQARRQYNAAPRVTFNGRQKLTLPA